MLAIVFLTSCDAIKKNEIKLLSKDRTHMLYLYPDENYAELYSGMSLINEFKLVNISPQTYELSPIKEPTLKITFKENSMNWHCIQCNKLKLATQWIVN
jgi:hypothetical protein